MGGERFAENGDRQGSNLLPLAFKLMLYQMSYEVTLA